jgi:hypothetical protein
MIATMGMPCTVPLGEVGRIEVRMRVEPDQSKVLSIPAEASAIRGNGAYRDGVISTEHKRRPPFFVNVEDHFCEMLHAFAISSRYFA